MKGLGKGQVRVYAIVDLLLIGALGLVVQRKKERKRVAFVSRIAVLIYIIRKDPKKDFPASPVA